jgi:hypothetical protein
MAHFAKLDATLTVCCVTVGREEDSGKELELCARTGETYRQTSYNTLGGVHYDPETGKPSEDQSKALRKNYAAVGFRYDPDRDAFIPPKPYPSWTLNEDSCQWYSPVPMPTEPNPGGYIWDENNQQWNAVNLNSEEQ